ncbi:MAG: 6-phosphofructokinase [Phycisphaerae bacterium]|nr:6-phosphofructokinase [Phycisphaerae bacterium]
MTKSLKRIGILTGGGDCPGLNAVIRAVAKPAIANGIEVMGIEDGYLGLIEERLRRLRNNDVSGILTTGGTILGSCNKANPSAYSVQENGKWVVHDVRDRVIKSIADFELDTVFVIGGDGTMSGAADLIDRGVNVIGVPKTIDNDLWATDITFGHDTAVTTATEALDKVHTTASSHHRVMVVEVMGRYAGWLALRSGLASGADVILIPEIPFSIEKICDHCITRSKHGKRFTIIAAGEGATLSGGKQFVDHIDESSPDPIRLGGVAKFVADQVSQNTGLESRSMVLGHIQRGGTPTPYDRILATQFGYYAFELLKEGVMNHLVVMKDNKLGSVPIKDVANKVRTVPPDNASMLAARCVGTSFGD